MIKMAWTEVADESELKAGESKAFEVNGKKMLISNVDGNIYSIDSICTHMGGDLSKGKKENGIVICPKHHAQFDLKTGKVVKNVGGFVRTMTRKEASDLKSYNVKIEDGKIKIDL